MMVFFPEKSMPVNFRREQSGANVNAFQRDVSESIAAGKAVVECGGDVAFRYLDAAPTPGPAPALACQPF